MKQIKPKDKKVKIATHQEASTEGKFLDTAQSTSLESTWMNRIEQLHQATTQSSGLECASRCNARCCPKAKKAANIETPIGHVAIMLPFELEYIFAKTDIDQNLFHHTQINFTSDTMTNIGFITSEKPCPFLTEQNQCGIYDIRPLDCRSFPLIPVFTEEGELNFRKDKDCPSAETFSTVYEAELKTLWQQLLPHLPMTYRLLYNAL